MSVLSGAIIPVVLLLGAGTAVKRWFLTDRSAWRGVEWLVYWVFTPALLVTSLQKADITAVEPGPLLASLVIPIVSMSLLVLLMGKTLRVDGPRLSSLIQGSIRMNTYIGLIFASALHGETGVATFALACAVVVPTINVISVSALSVYGDKAKRTRTPSLPRELAENPFIIGCAIGVTLSAASIQIPNFLQTTLNLLSSPAMACGTLAAGAALRFSFRRRDILDIGLATTLKLLILPLATGAIAIPLGLTGPALTSVVLISALPTAASSYVLAVRMGGDTRLMAAITAVQTVASVATIPFILALTDHLAR